MTKRLNILITNDDGIHAPGIRHLWNALHEFADVTVIAPDREQSAVSLSITVRKALHIDSIDWGCGANAWCINGTPADCIKLGLNAVLDTKPDLIVSGINRGSNAGRNILYSGTVAGAIEGVMHDIPSIAFSCYDYHKMPNFARAEQYIPSIVEHVIEHPLPQGTLLNVNFPIQDHAIKGFKYTRNGMQFWAENPDCRMHPTEERNTYWLGARMAEFPEHEDCDISWLEKGYVTAVPIQVNDLTHGSHLAEKKEAFENLFSTEKLTQ